MSIDKQNWYEKSNYLNNIFLHSKVENNPKTWDHIEQWIISFDKSMTQQDYEIFLSQIPNSDVIIKNKIGDFLSKNNLIQKRDFNELWKKTHNHQEKDQEDINLSESINLIAKELLQEFKIATLINKYGKSTGIIYIRSGISYTTDIEPLIKSLNKKCQEIKKSTYKTIKNNVLEIIEDSTLIDPITFFCDDPFIIPFENGFYEGITGEFFSIKEIDREKYRFFYHIPIEFKTDKKYNCKYFKHTLRTWLANEENSIKGTNTLDIFEMYGLSLSMNTSFKKSFILLGPKDCGKTQFLNILNSIIPEKIRSATPLHRLGKNEFGLDELPYKIANIRDDLPEDKILRTGTFKDITGGGISMEAEIKGGAKFKFKPYAKFWFATNKLGEPNDLNDEAFFGRFYITHFKHTFSKEDSNTQPDFYKRIIDDKDEIQGIIQESLKGFHRLVKRKHFREVLDKNTQHIWLYNANPMYRFISDNCVRDPKERIEWNEFKNAYVSEMISSDTPQQINIRLTALSFVKQRGSENNEKLVFVKGLTWKPFYEEKLKEDNNNTDPDLDKRLNKLNKTKESIQGTKNLDAF